MLLTIYMKRIYITCEGQKHFVLCDEMPALRHFFYFISQYINCEFFYLYLKLGIWIAVYINE